MEILEKSLSNTFEIGEVYDRIQHDGGVKMKTQIVTKKDVNMLAEALQNDEVIAFPTETVYGLGIVYDSKKAMEKLKWAKKRPESKPFTLMVADKKMIADFAITTKRDWKIIEHFMPGPLTLIFKRKEEVDASITNGFDTIGIRCPDDEFVLDLIRKAGKPLLVPSANISGEPAALSSDEVLAQLDGRISMVVQGQCGSGKASTILNLCEDDIKVIRQGELTLKQIEEVLS